MSNELAVQATQTAMQSYCFANAQAFEAAQRMATALSKATLVPKEYNNNIPNCIIALEIAQRMSASPLMIMQNLYIVHGKPGWSSQFIISAINTCGRFRPLRFDLTGIEGSDERSCVAWTTEKNMELPANIRTLTEAKAANLPVLESPKISIAIAKKEGWYGKNGSKWQTMPELMLHYRAASFFGKLYAPEILMGMQTAEEVEDIVPIKDVTPRDNTPLKEAFIDNAPETPQEPKNKMDEILSCATPKPVVEEPIQQQFTMSPAQQKCDEIISLLQKAKTEKEIKQIHEKNQGHIQHMDEGLQSLINVTIDEKIKSFVTQP